MTDLQDIAKRIHEAIDAYAERAYNDGNRKHLGASIIGDECSRKTWSTFRWLKSPSFTGRMQRLFRRGHLEELRFIEYLKAIGFTVNDRDEDGKQIRISDCSGHFGGSLDGVCSFPLDWNIPGQFLLEFKTKGTGAGFVKLREKGVALSSPEHWGQMCVYGYKRGIEYALYFTVNKNDDDLHIEMVKLDHGLGADLIRKAGMLIESQRAPEKISNTPTFFKCKYCQFVDICHNGEPVEKNCRSCLHAIPAPDAKWSCRHWNAIIPDDVIPVGCDAHISIV